MLLFDNNVARYAWYQEPNVLKLFASLCDFIARSMSVASSILQAALELHASKAVIVVSVLSALRIGLCGCG